MPEAQDDLLAEERGEHRHAELHLLVAGHLHLDAAVLRQATLGDVEVRHHLEPRGDRVLQPQRRLHDLVEHAVDAEADPEHLLVGLDVDVACPLADRVGQQRVHQPHDGRFLGGALEFL
jgi:hypothetical protein